MIAALVFAGVTLGAPVRQAIAKRGDPTVVTTDVGHVWTWQEPGKTLRVTTDDAGNVQMVDVAPSARDDGSLTVPDSAAHPIAFDTTRAAAAQAAFAAESDFRAMTTLPDSGGAALLQAYQMDGKHELALLFDAHSQLLREAFYGDRIALARAGLIPELAKSLPSYKAPVLQKLGSADYASADQGVAYLRIVVDEHGSVTGASIYLSSGNVALDRIALASARHDTFTPAQRNGAPVASVYFRREDFINTTRPR